MITKSKFAVQAIPFIALVIMVLGACTSTSSSNTDKSATTKKVDPYEPSYQAISALVALGDMDKAASAYEKEAAEHPNSINAQSLYAKLLLGAGKIEKAKEILEPLAANNPGNADIQYSASILAALAGNKDAQKAALDRTLKAQPDHSEALSALGELQLQGKHFPEAEQSFDRSLKKDPRNFVAMVGKAAVLSRTDHLEEAQSFLDKAVALQPNYSFAYSDRAKVEAELRNFNAAESDMAKSIELEPDFAYNYLDRGRIRARAGKTDEAIADFSKVLDMNPKLFLARVYRAEIYRFKGDWNSVLSDLNVVIKQRPDYYPAYEPLGLSAWKSGDFQTASDWFEKSWDPLMKNESALLLAAIALFNSDNKPAFKVFVNEQTANFKREGLNWQVLRYLFDPAQEGPTVNMISNWKNANEKAQASLAMGIGLLKSGRKQSAVLFLQNVIDSLPSLSAEAQIATWIIDEYKR